MREAARDWQARLLLFGVVYQLIAWLKTSSPSRGAVSVFIGCPVMKVKTTH